MANNIVEIKLSEIDKVQEVLSKQNQEIERLNNIIKQLEETIEQRWTNWKDSDCLEFIGMTNEDKFILDYLKELKQSVH